MNAWLGLVKRVTFHNAENGFCVVTSTVRKRALLLTREMESI